MSYSSSTVDSCGITYQCLFCVRFWHYVEPSVDADSAVHRDVIVVQQVLLARRFHLAEVKGLGVKVQLGARLVDDCPCYGIDTNLEEAVAKNRRTISKRELFLSNFQFGRDYTSRRTRLFSPRNIDLGSQNYTMS